MRVCINTVTGRVVEAQSGDTDDFTALLLNARNANLDPAILEFRIWTAELLEAKLKQQRMADMPPRRRPRALADIASGYLALSPDDRQLVAARAVALALQNNPAIARDVGIPLDGDEPLGK